MHQILKHVNVTHSCSDNVRINAREKNAYTSPTPKNNFGKK